MLAVFCSHLVSIMQFRQSLLFFSSFIGPFDFVLRCLNLFMSKPYFHCVLTTNHWHEELYSAQVSLASFFWVFFYLYTWIQFNLWLKRNRKPTTDIYVSPFQAPHSPAAMPLLASSMMPVRPTLKMALWPKLSMASVDVVFKEDDS